MASYRSQPHSSGLDSAIYSSAEPSQECLSTSAEPRGPSTQTSATPQHPGIHPPSLPAFDFESQPSDFGQDLDADSAFGGESYLSDDTKTLSTFITDYRFENGRRYHSYQDGAYWGPNDEHANEQQDLAHHMYLLTLEEKLYLAPIKNIHRVLDVGTGTGIWAIDMADQHPEATVIGTDLSPIQPDFVPPNCSFEIDDVTLEWTYPEDHFDFIHVREMFGSIPDWDAFFEQAFKHTKPGGWVEVVEHSVQPVSDDSTVGPDHFFTTWGNTVIAAGEKFGKSFAIWREAKDRMIKAGFENVVEVHYKWPMNGWPRDKRLKELGRWNQLRLHDGIEGMMLRLLTSALGVRRFSLCVCVTTSGVC